MDTTTLNSTAIAKEKEQGNNMDTTSTNMPTPVILYFSDGTHSPALVASGDAERYFGLPDRTLYGLQDSNRRVLVSKGIDDVKDKMWGRRANRSKRILDVTKGSSKKYQEHIIVDTLLAEMDRDDLREAARQMYAQPAVKWDVQKNDIYVDPDPIKTEIPVRKTEIPARRKRTPRVLPPKATPSPSPIDEDEELWRQIFEDLDLDIENPELPPLPYRRPPVVPSSVRQWKDCGGSDSAMTRLVVESLQYQHDLAQYLGLQLEDIFSTLKNGAAIIRSKNEQKSEVLAQRIEQILSQIVSLSNTTTTL